MFVPVYVDISFINVFGKSKTNEIIKEIKGIIGRKDTFTTSKLSLDGYPHLIKYIYNVRINIPSSYSVVSREYADLHIKTFIFNDEIGSEHLDDEDTTSACQEYVLPHTHFDGQWEALQFDTNIKDDLLSYASTAMMFARHNIDQSLINCNRMVLLYGPAGTGKTTLCKALAHQLSLRLNHIYSNTVLIEINAHSLFSKWFSESGKLIQKLFSYIDNYVHDENTMVCILIDEVESLAMSRSMNISNNEPSDSVRAANSLLTQIDKISKKNNVLLLATTNITHAIDSAFLDRADIRRFVGYSGMLGRYRLLSECVHELCSKKTLVTSTDCTNGYLDYDTLIFCLNSIHVSVNTNFILSKNNKPSEPHMKDIKLTSLLRYCSSIEERVNQLKYNHDTGPDIIESENPSLNGGDPTTETDLSKYKKLQNYIQNLLVYTIDEIINILNLPNYTSDPKKCLLSDPLHIKTLILDKIEVSDVDMDIASITSSLLLLSVAVLSSGLSGRSLRKLSFQAFVYGNSGGSGQTRGTVVNHLHNLEDMLLLDDLISNEVDTFETNLPVNDTGSMNYIEQLLTTFLSTTSKTYLSFVLANDSPLKHPESPYLLTSNSLNPILNCPSFHYQPHLKSDSNEVGLIPLELFMFALRYATLDRKASNI